MLLIGVLISWLIWAKNEDLAWLAASAAFKARDMAKLSSSRRTQMAAICRVSKYVAINIMIDKASTPLDANHHCASTLLREMATATVTGKLADVRK